MNKNIIQGHQQAKARALPSLQGDQCDQCGDDKLPAAQASPADLTRGSRIVLSKTSPEYLRNSPDSSGLKAILPFPHPQ